MLNSERKQYYLDQEKFKTFDSGTMINIKKTINIFSNYENVIDKDICDWTIAEIKEALISVNSKSSGTIKNYISHLKDYTDWCINNKLSNINQNNFNNITMDIIDSVINKTLIKMQLITRDQLLNKISLLLNARDKFLLLALYEGIGGYGKGLCEIIEIKNNDINHEKKTVKLCTGREFKMSNDLYQFAIESIGATEYYARKSNITEDDYVVKYKRNEDDVDHVYWALSKGNVDDKQGGILQTIKRINVLTGLKTMTTKSYIRAGRYWYVKSRADAAGLSMVEYEREHKDEVDNIYGKMSIATRCNWYDFLRRQE